MTIDVETTDVMSEAEALETAVSDVLPEAQLQVFNPVVAIVGRPNVGKSTLVNRIIGSRQAIVHDMPGVTRDRSYYDAEWQNRHFTLVDTGGLMPDEKEGFTRKVNHQVELALEEASVVVFIVDVLTGITDADESVMRKMRALKKPVILAVNKVDNKEAEMAATEFYSLGVDEYVCLSALHGNLGVGDLLDKVISYLPEQPEETHSDAIKIALIGRPNVGKSSILNQLLGEERTIVSDVAGTTRDAIHARLEDGDQPFILVDTAGIRKKKKVDYGVEMFSVDRSIRAIESADVTVMVLDATENTEAQAKPFITDQDKKLIEISNRSGNGLLLVVNKWDLVKNKESNTIKKVTEQVYREIPHAKFAPVLFISALNGQRVKTILSKTKEIVENCQRRVSTSVINDVINEALIYQPPSFIKNKQLSIKYATQAQVSPPTFLLFCNDAKLMKDSYKRYLENQIRSQFEFSGTPIFLVPRTRGDKA